LNFLGISLSYRAFGYPTSMSEDIGTHTRRILVLGVVGVTSGTKINSPAVFEGRPELLFRVRATSYLDAHTYILRR